MMGSWEGGIYLQVLMGKLRHGAGTCGPHPHCGYGHPITDTIRQVYRHQEKGVREIFSGLPSSGWTPSSVTSPGRSEPPQQQTLPPNPPSAPAPHHKSLPSIGRGPFKKDLLGGFKHRQRYGFINRKAIALIITGSFGGWHPRSPHSYGRANSPLPGAAASIAPLCLPVCGDHERGKSPDRECKCLFFVNEEHN